MKDLMNEHAEQVKQVDLLQDVEQMMKKQRQWRMQELDSVRRAQAVTRYGHRRRLRHWIRIRPFTGPPCAVYEKNRSPSSVLEELQALRELGQVKELVRKYKERLEAAINQEREESARFAARRRNFAQHSEPQEVLPIPQEDTQTREEPAVRSILRSSFRDQLEQLLQRMLNRHHAEARAATTPTWQRETQTPATQGELQEGSTLQELERKLERVNRLLSTCIEMQSETHRAIRQEVSAAMKDTVSGASTPLEVHSTPFEAGKCTVCCDRNIDAVMYKCGHMVACYHCAREIRDRGRSCPLCRASIVEVIKTYRAT
eukprot:scaffold587_cov339-Pavlova_lutheri.AAC.73